MFNHTKKYLSKGLLGIITTSIFISCPNMNSDQEVREVNLYSRIKKEDAIILKEHKEELDYMEKGIVYGMASRNLAHGMMMGASMSEPEKDLTIIKGKTINFQLDDKKIYEKFKQDERVCVTYLKSRNISERNELIDIQKGLCNIK